MSPCTKINSKWTKHLNARPETINYIQENTDTKLMDRGLREDFINLTPEAREVKAKLNEWNYIKLKSFCIAQEIANQTKRQPTKQEMTFATTALTRG